MQPAPISDTLRSWHEFFGLIGSTSATLMGLVFVAVSLVVGLPMQVVNKRDIFATPIVVQFAYALALSALSLAPWGAAHAYGRTMITAGVLGSVQSLWLIRGMKEHHRSSPVPRAAWVWSVAAPTTAALLVVAGGVWTSMGWSGGVGMIAASVLLLDLVGVRSSWMLFTALLRQRQT